MILGQTTAEDITCTLGPPLRTYYKEDVRCPYICTDRIKLTVPPYQTRLSIHDQTSNSANGTEIPPNAYFFNYFSLGLDFLFHPESNKLIKILLHSNTPGEVLFGRYNRCRWRLKRNGQSEGVATSEDDVRLFSQSCRHCQDMFVDLYDLIDQEGQSLLRHCQITWCCYPRALSTEN